MTSDFQARNDSTERLDRLSASEYFAHFTRVDKPNDHILDILARDVWLEEVYRSNRTVVLRAWLAEVAKDEETANTVICKIARGDGALMRLEHEYHIYQYLEELQGSLIPKCFGIFRAEPTGAQGFDEACLLLEDCGRRMDKPIKDMSWQFRREVVAIVQRMHKIGVEHGDIFDYSENNGNILIRHIKFEGDGDSEHVVPCIIDFDNAKEHQCRVPMDISRRVWGVHSQRGRQFVCQEFIKIANDLDWVYPIRQIRESIIDIWEWVHLSLEEMLAKVTGIDLSQYRAAGPEAEAELEAELNELQKERDKHMQELERMYDWSNRWPQIKKSHDEDVDLAENEIWAAAA